MRLGQLQHKSAMLWHPASLLQSAALRLILYRWLLVRITGWSWNQVRYITIRAAHRIILYIILTIVASDSLAGIHRGSASAVITLAAINPPEVMVDIKPIAAIY